MASCGQLKGQLGGIVRDTSGMVGGITGTVKLEGQLGGLVRDSSGDGWVASWVKLE